MFSDGVGDRIEVVHGDAAFEAIRAARAARLLALVQQSLHARLALVARVHEIKIRRPPRLEAPAEHGFVEATAALDVVGVNGEAGKIVGHEPRIVELALASQSRYSDI